MLVEEVGREVRVGPQLEAAARQVPNEAPGVEEPPERVVDVPVEVPDRLPVHRPRPEDLLDVGRRVALGQRQRRRLAEVAVPLAPGGGGRAVCRRLALRRSARCTDGGVLRSALPAMRRTVARASAATDTVSGRSPVGHRTITTGMHERRTYRRRGTVPRTAPAPTRSADDGSQSPRSAPSGSATTSPGRPRPAALAGAAS